MILHEKITYPSKTSNHFQSLESSSLERKDPRINSLVSFHLLRTRLCKISTSLFANQYPIIWHQHRLGFSGSILMWTFTSFYRKPIYGTICNLHRQVFKKIWRVLTCEKWEKRGENASADPLWSFQSIQKKKKINQKLATKQHTCSTFLPSLGTQPLLEYIHSFRYFTCFYYVKIVILIDFGSLLYDSF